MNLWIVLLTGLTVGGLTCLALQGGLLASVIASQNLKSSYKDHILPTLAFLVSKLLAYTLLGFALGVFGEKIALTDQIRSYIQIFAGLYMIAIALNLLNVHPVFRYVVIQPPKFIFKIVRNESKSSDFFAPALLGFLTILIPCGTTLAMEALAISTGNGFASAAIMATFVLGTAPYFLGIGYVSSHLKNPKSKIVKLASIAIIYLAVTSINGALIILNSPYNLQTLSELMPIEISIGEEGQKRVVESAQIIDGVQTYNLKVTSSGYNPDYLKVKSNQKVRLNLNSVDAYSCALAFRIPAFGISKNLAPNGSDIVEFTPTQKGKIAFSCSMGMYRGVIEVI